MRSGAITRLGFAPNYGNAWLYLYAWMKGGEFMSADRRRVTLNTPPVVQALEWMTRVYDSLGGAPAVYAFQSSAQTGQLDPFLTGKVAMKIDGYWTFPEALAQYRRAISIMASPSHRCRRPRQIKTP